MSTLQINPPDIDKEYLQGLNAAFGNWGDRRQFEWYFRRETIFLSPDLLVFREGGKIAAGSGITYRCVRFPDQEEMIVAIMTGSWTLPQHRGQGFFTRMIETSLQRATERSAQLLLAFVTEDNASFRQLRAFGALLFPSFYLFSTESTPVPNVDTAFEQVEPKEEIVAEMFEKFTGSGAGFARFQYPSPRDFRAQFCDRPHPTEVWSDRNRNFAVIEKRADTNLLQLYLAQDEKNFLADLLVHALKQNRKFFAFTMQEETAVLGHDFGLGLKKGFLTVLPTNASVQLPPGLRWRIQNGDRA